jgi:hypothetical protein
MATYTKQALSGSTDGKGIKVVATATLGTTIHTAQSSTTEGEYDEVWLYAFNSDSTPVLLTIEWGGVTDPDSIIEVPIPSQEGLMTIIPGLILHNSLVVTAFAASANVITITGFVNRISV